MAIIQSTPTVGDVLSGTHDINDTILGDKQDIITEGNDILSEVFGSEEKCPPLGFTLPELPAIGQFGDIADTALDFAGVLPWAPLPHTLRVISPLSAMDTLKEFAGKATPDAGKILLSLKRAAFVLQNQVKEQVAAKWDEGIGMMNGLEQAVKAVGEGTIDTGKLGMDVMDMPAKVLEGAFPGFKGAVGCLGGVVGSGESAFNKKSPELLKGLASGRGLSATTADEGIINQIENIIDENGISVKKQKTISPADAIKSVIGTTKIAVPQSVNPIATYQYVSRI